MHRLEDYSWGVMTDSQIWRELKKGDWEAFEHIYRTYTKDLFNYGMKIYPNSNLVEDAMQELFVELWNSRQNQTGPVKIKFYLLKALKWKMNHHITRERKMYSDQPLEAVREIEVSLPFETELLTGQLSEQRKHYLLKAMDELSDRQKEIIQLLFFEQLSHAEIAELLNVRVRTVYVTAYRALASLKESLAPHALKLFLHWAVLILCWS